MAGNYCYVLDYGALDTQEEFQEDQREFISEAGITISRPFFALDCYSYGDTLLFVYLDEDDDPIVQHLTFETEEIRELQTLKNLINARMDRVKEGINPF